MTAKEDAYVEAFRRLVAKRDEIIAFIAQLRKVSLDLDSWQKTAGELARAVPSTRPEWFNEQLTIPVSRALLRDYHSLAIEVERQWGELKREHLEIGYADPSTPFLPSGTPSSKT